MSTDSKAAEPTLVGYFVRVDNPQFTGYGYADYDTGPQARYIGVRLENDNTWEYEISTVRPIDAAELEKVPRVLRERFPRASTSFPAGAPAQQGVAALTSGQEQQDGIWAIMFEDPERETETFVGAGATAAAIKRFAALKVNWNCHLLKCVESSPARELSGAPPVSEGLKAGSNYVADDEIYPTKVEFANGRVVTIKCEEGRVFLGIGMNRPDVPEIESHGVTFLNPPLSEEEPTLESLLDHLCNSDDKTFCQRGRAELREILGQRFSPPGTKAGPRCPKCGSGKSLVLRDYADGCRLTCGANCGLNIRPNAATGLEFDLADFAQFFPLPSSEQGWVKEAARLAFSRGGPIADWYCWCEICCLLRRVIPSPPRPSTEEGK